MKLNLRGRSFHPKTWRMLAYVLLAVVGALGFNRLQTQQDTIRSLAAQNEARAVEAKQTADQLGALVAQREEDRLATSLQACQIRNTAQRNGRDRFVQLFINLNSVVGPGTRQQENANKLQEGIQLDPTKEDRDCDSDGALTDKDYTSDTDKPSAPEDQTSRESGSESSPTTSTSSSTTTTTTTTSPPSVTLPPAPNGSDLTDPVREFIKQTCKNAPEVCNGVL